jgi:hypothetical protein
VTTDERPSLGMRVRETACWATVPVAALTARRRR